MKRLSARFFTLGLVLGYGLSWIGGHYHLFSLAPEVYSIDYVPFAPRFTENMVPVTATRESPDATYR